MTILHRPAWRYCLWVERCYRRLGWHRWADNARDCADGLVDDYNRRTIGGV